MNYSVNCGFDEHFYELKLLWTVVSKAYAKRTFLATLAET